MNISEKEKIYLRLPVIFQNILVTIAGLVERKRRFFGAHNEKLSEIRKCDKFSNSERSLYVRKDIEKFIDDARNNVPYYKGYGTKLDDFPVLTKEQVRKNYNNLISKNFKKDSLLKINTGGSSGTPLQVMLSKSCRQKSYAFWSDFYQRMNVENNSKKLSLVGRKVCSPSNTNPPFWRHAYLTNQMLLSNFHISKDFIEPIVDEINKFQPVIIEGYAQSVVNLARIIKDSGQLLKISPKCISVSSESFSHSDRNLMETVFGCKVYNQYGSAETVVFAYECSNGNMHFQEQYGYVEVRTESGEIRDHGTGDLIVTGLLNDAQPLIRYEIGDTGTIAYSDCDCGVASKCLLNLSGRIGDSLIIGDRVVPTAAVSLFFKYSPEIDRAQVISDTKNNEITVLVEASCKTVDFSPISEEINKSISENVIVHYKHVKSIAPEKNGKYKLVKNV